MTDLLTRTPPGSARNEAPAGRPLTVSAALAGLVAAGSGLVVCLAVAVTGWFLADGGAHGDTRDALRVGADAWLLGHGSHLTYGGVTYTVVPLGLTALLAWVAFRAGRWAGATSPTADDRELLGEAGADDQRLRRGRDRHLRTLSRPPPKWPVRWCSRCSAQSCSPAASAAAGW